MPPGLLQANNELFVKGPNTLSKVTLLENGS